MEPRQAGVEAGWGWLGCGWQIFMKSPGLWIVLIILYFVVSVVLSLIPLVGGLVNALLAPALFGGLLYGTRQLQSGQSLEVGQLFQAFRDSSRTSPMLVLGAVSLVAGLVSLVLGGGMIMSGMYGAHMMGGGGLDGTPAGAAGVGLLGLLVFLVINAAMAMALFYATPLVMLDGMAPVEALKTSVGASLRNIAPLTVLGLIVLVLAIVAALPAFLGYLVLGPVMVGAVYCSYEEVFPPAAPAAPPAEPPSAIPPPPPPPPPPAA